jgi:hypothetical protein
LGIVADAMMLAASMGPIIWEIWPRLGGTAGKGVAASRRPRLATGGWAYGR